MTASAFIGRLINEESGASVRVDGVIEFEIDSETGLVKNLTGTFQLPQADLHTVRGDVLRESDLAEETDIDLEATEGAPLGTRVEPLSLNGSGFELEIQSIGDGGEITLPFTVRVSVEVVCIQPGEWLMIRWQSRGR